MSDLLGFKRFSDRLLGEAPIFPQSSMTLLPGASKILSISHPRYRRMVADALRGNRLIAIALCKPGKESADDENRPCHDIVCLGRMLSPTTPSDDTQHIYLQGLQRARIVQEIPASLPYRLGKLELLEDNHPSVPVINRENRYAELVSLFRQLFPKLKNDAVFQIRSEIDHPLGGLCDVLAEALRMDPQWKQELLAELNVDCRSDRLLDMMRSLSRRQQEINFAQPGFLAFSPN